MQRAERKLQLSHNVVGEDVVHSEEKEKTGVETGDLQSVIFGLHMFDPKEIDNEESDGLKLSELNTMAEKVIAMRHEQIPVKAGQNFTVSPVDLLDGSDLGQGSSASVHFDPGLDEASYLSWVENENGGFSCAAKKFSGMYIFLSYILFVEKLGLLVHSLSTLNGEAKLHLKHMSPSTHMRHLL
ncbi:hypothetical protein Patl1_00153 [Pistacia atlantica]|uniref:Uncharacterized protein n=1 Tax=Pistacia atlantica TaxID=434234 RepID=A0ACC1CAU6_9ROSI|nr:hypothetical protein Patl1_00153 [Pistacia atlantica]